MPKEFKNRWVVPGDEKKTDIPAIASVAQYYKNRYLSYAYNAYNYSTARVADGGFIRLKNISLTYDFEPQLVSKIGLSSCKNKTLIGINGARLCTTWYATQEIIDALNAAGVPSMSTSGGGGTLPNGTKVTEEAEYHTRRIIIEMTGDKNEAYRNSGVLSLSKCQNIIIRNLKFVGPGSIDVGGSDLLSFNETKNCWVDHCDFTDGMDGNFDITQKSDFNTVSWCSFSYTDRSYMHQNTNLIGSSDSESTGYLNTTFAFCHWGKNCRARMPMARVGKIHMLNNYFTTTTGSNCINPRKNSEFLIEGNYFAISASKSYSQSGAIAVTWRSDNYFASGSTPSSLGSTVTVPYDYTVADVQTIPSVVTENVGATLYTTTGITVPFAVPANTTVYNLSGQRLTKVGRGLYIVNGKKIVVR
jgi:pectate lyase